ncbi:uncharacterized protein B0I36DRAFT_363207 [Microdochium trichocladiopsis]|uniref:NAD-dependent epimerase/dehydratase domain-containing protein n=1 Tax=Microdochium trichocladiopsis TaxID=1682393 RepID=A0A9P8Y7Y8_9PEZI|nr:uncharacterized protein B0I36DRAFT_363207 [Microdochium trichocladiopsis]KAH7031528.1 hypothetical protein B0I36DRAFT_363207 [Microdochium trichocladiopsis]
MAPTVLVTGASGFVAGHVLDKFLAKGYNVRGTVRSEKTAANVRKMFPEYPEQLSFAIVPDMAAPGAFDEAVKGVDGIIHTASPFILDAKDVQKDLYDPAVQGTTSILEAAQKHAPTVSRVVVTSSFASVLDPNQGTRPGYTYTEADWNPVIGDAAAKDPVLAYLASKAMAEKAAFDYVEKNKPTFTVTTLLPPMVYGPVRHHVDSVKSLNTSSTDILRLFNGSETTVPTTSFWGFVDVRDLADAHVLAFETPEAAGQRYLTTTGNYSYQQVVDIIRREFPELQATTPEGEAGAPLPPVYRIDNSKAKKELGIKFTPLEKTIVDTVKSLRALKE